MRLLPASLFGRMVLILVSGLVLAQLLSAALHLRESDVLLYRSSGLQSAEHIADIVALLDKLQPADRQQVVDAFNVPPLMIALTRTPTNATAQESSGLATIFAAVIRHRLDDNRPIQVSVSRDASMPLPTMFAHGMMMPPMAHLGMMPMHGAAFHVQVRLRDGTWAVFDQHVSQQVFRWPYQLLVNLLILLAAVIVLSLIAVRGAVRPLQVLANAADELGTNINRPPLPETGPTEIRRAAHAFNTMQARLAQFIQDRTRVLTAISHDLKTPITRMLLRAELLEDEGMRNKFTADLKDMSLMVSTALDYLRGVDAQENVQPIDVMALLESLQANAAEMGKEVVIEGTAHQYFPGRPQALKRCLANLVDNAVQYGRRAWIGVEDTAETLRIRVRDEGPGIPEAELAKVFEPFYRLEASRNRETGGTGLGLSIARNIAQLHGGTLELRNRPEGGLEAILTLPRMANPSGTQ